MYDTVLIPTDGSEGVGDAIEEGVELAALTGATVHALYVVDSRDYGTVPDAAWFGLQEALKDEGEAAVEAVAARAAESGVDIVTAIEQGVPHDAIVDYADAEGIDCIVMGTHGRSGVDRLLLGSVTENVVRHTGVPVHIVRVGNGSTA
jgi:nucleotide-binding universal stress UspA family protein